MNWFNTIFYIFKVPQNILQLPEICRIPRNLQNSHCCCCSKVFLLSPWGHRDPSPALSLQHKVIICAPEKSAKLELKMQHKKPSSRGQKGFGATVWISSYKEIPAHLLFNMDLISKPAAAPRAPTATLSWGTKCSYFQ